MRLLRELRAVGIRDWVWFVLYLRRNEFSSKLNIIYWIDKGVDLPKVLHKVTQVRARAHKIDMKLKDIK